MLQMWFSPLFLPPAHPYPIAWKTSPSAFTADPVHAAAEMEILVKGIFVFKMHWRDVV